MFLLYDTILLIFSLLPLSVLIFHFTSLPLTPRVAPNAATPVPQPRNPQTPLLIGSVSLKISK